MLDTSAIGNVISSAILGLEAEFDAGEVREVSLVVEVDEGERPTEWRVFGSNGRVWLQRIVLEMGLGQVDSECAECEAD
jgi:hypothetical protein